MLEADSLSRSSEPAQIYITHWLTDWLTCGWKHQFSSRQVTNNMCPNQSYCVCLCVCVCVCVIPTHLHHPHRRSSCRGSRWRGPRRTPTGWCGSAISPCTGPPSGPGRPAWPSAAGHSSRGVRLAASWMAVSCPRGRSTSPRKKGSRARTPEVHTPKEIGATTYFQQVAAGALLCLCLLDKM